MTKRTYYKSVDYISQNEVQGYEKVIHELQEKIDAKTDSAENFNFGAIEKPKTNKNHYAEELKKQIEAKKFQKELEKAERFKPAISESFNGYPNLPSTPKNIRRQKELQKKKNWREDLASQLLAKKNDLQVSLNKKIEIERKTIDEEALKMTEEKYKKIKKKEIEKATLVNAWNLAQKAKELQKLLENKERKALSTTRIENYDDNILYSPQTTTGDQYFQAKVIKDEEPEIRKSDIKPHEKISQKEMVRNKAIFIKNSIEKKEKENYQYKIKKIIEQAKKIRELQKNF